MFCIIKLIKYLINRMYSINTLEYYLAVLFIINIDDFSLESYTIV